MSFPKVKYFYQPAYTQGQWATRNPLLKAGQLGIELDNQGLARRIKCGPGKWNDLPYLETDIYPYTDVVTNPLGDLVFGQTVENQEVREILRSIISPFVTPTLSNVANNADGVFSNDSVFEFGEALAGTVDISFNVDLPQNLDANNPIVIDSNGLFANDGAFPYDGNPITMQLAQPLNPVGQVEYQIKVYARGSDGVLSQAYTTVIRWVSTLLWGESQDPAIFDFTQGAVNINPFPSANRRAQQGYEIVIDFSGNAFSYVLIPTIKNPAGIPIDFSDITKPDSPDNYSMLDLGVCLINNGVATYQYRVYRSEFELIFPTRLRIS